MTRLAPLIAAGLFLVYTAYGQQEKPFENVMETFLACAPMQVAYHYTLTDGSFLQEGNGTLVLIAPGKFRLDLWDKIFGSDGSSLYLYDRNTRQTVIDSLRWTDVNLWVRLLQGNLPKGTITTRGETAPQGVVRLELQNEELRWSCTIEVDTSARAIHEIMLREERGWEHLVRLEAPTPWNGVNPDSVLALKDLPGLRLDLR